MYERCTCRVTALNDDLGGFRRTTAAAMADLLPLYAQSKYSQEVDIVSQSPRLSNEHTEIPSVKNQPLQTCPHMASSEAPSKLRIAISGGGLAGAAIANALFRQPHLDVHVYESAKEFSESGNAIGIAINAQRALSMIVPDADNLYRRVQAMQKSSTRIMIVGVGTGLLSNS